MLGVCDARTVEHKHLVPHDLVYPHYIGENFQVKYDSRQRWYFLDNMQPDDAVIFKNFDSSTDGRARSECILSYAVACFIFAKH